MALAHAASTPLLAWDTEMERNIHFRSISDALIATLYLTHSLPEKTINLFLDVIHNLDFVPREVTFKNANDIEGHVARHNTKLSERRSDAAATFHPRSLFPFTVLELVLDSICAEILVCRDKWRKMEVESSNVDEVHNLYINTLRNASLVCRSWTSACQRRLARMIKVTTCLSESSLLLRLIRSPYVCSSCQHLSIVELPDFASRFVHFAVKASLCTLVAALSNLRSLEIRSLDSLEVVEFIRIVGQLKHLEDLKWRTSGCDDAAIAQLYAALNGVPNLRKIHLDGRIVETDPLALRLFNSLPTRMFPLEHLTLSLFSGPRYYVRYLEWLLRPSERSIITHLRLLVVGQMDIILDVLSSLTDVKFLDTLEISHIGSNLHVPLNRLLSQCSSLHIPHVRPVRRRTTFSLSAVNDPYSGYSPSQGQSLEGGSEVDGARFYSFSGSRRRLCSATS